jgi:glycosyltransferase involved in cell wall biosynthesis
LEDDLAGSSVLVVGATEPLGVEVAREAARRGPERLLLLDADEAKLGDLATHVPVSAELLVVDPDDRDAMRAVLARHRPEVVIQVVPTTGALVESDPPGWPADRASERAWLAIEAAEHSCRSYLLVTRTDLFDPTSVPARRQDPLASDASLRAALENERANAEHLRRLSRQQREQLRRKLVRLALAIDERSDQLGREVDLRRRRVSRRIAKVGLIATALPARRHLTADRAHLVAAIDKLADPPPLTTRVSVILVADGPLRCPPLPPGDDVELVVVLTGSRAAPPPDTPVTIVRSEYKTLTAAAASGAARAKGKLLCFLAPTSEPWDETWLARLADAIHGDVMAATPMLVHPERPLAESTPHDLRVRELGLEVIALPSSGPVVEARGAGTRGRPDQGVVEVAASSGACLLVDRIAFDEAGGLASIEIFDAAVVDLCGRLRAGGGKVVVVPSAVVTDHRPVRSRRSLTRPIDPDSRAWRAVVDRQGPTLLQLARGDRVTEHLRIALTVAAPSLRVAPRWGDWHLAQAMARALRRMGHSVHLQTADQADDPVGRACDVHVVLRGLTPVERTPGQRHVLWLISHPESLDTKECDDADVVLVASERFAEDLRHRTSTPVEVMLQATDPKRFSPYPPDPRHSHAVAVVAMTRHVFRPSVAYALAAGLRPAIYGTGWQEFVDPELIVAEFIPNDELATVYSSVGVLLNDHWDTMRAWGVVSNRLFDALACGTPVVSDYMPEVDDLFGDSVATYRDADELRAAVDLNLDDPVAARQRAVTGREIVLAGHTFDHRARELLDALARYGLDRPPR